jgi:long-chain fatty acid transport protein
LGHPSVRISVTHIDGQNVYNAGLSYVTSVVDDEDRTIDLPLDDSFVISLAASRNASESLTYGVGGAIIFNGDAAVDQTAQGTRFAGEFDTNIIFAIGASLQWRF